MYINITASETGDNKGSCGALVNYLEKENRIRNQETEKWFNGKGRHILPHEVRVGIDGNIAKLGREDSKFFLINISPSQKELSHLVSQYGEQGARDKLKEFAIRVMDEYARNFKRPGIESHQDLLWFGKLENYRYYSQNDKEVNSGTKNRGERKEGRQMHVQIIVSRKDITNRIKLSPQNTSRGKNKAHSQKLGQFDRTAFKQSGEALFDDLFNFERGLNERMDYAVTMKKGTVQQKAQLHTMQYLAEKYPDIRMNDRMDHLVTHIRQDKYSDIGDLLSSITSNGLGLLNILFDPVYDSSSAGQGMAEEEARKRKRRRKKWGQQRS